MGRSRKRDVDIVIISDVHLGTYGCHAIELLRYLKSIRPTHLILNGDIIDMWQFSKHYWPTTHMQVIKEITKLLTRNTQVTYLTGNHDEMLRKFAGLKTGGFHIDNKKRLLLHGKKVWIFHGDVFDITMRHSKWLAKLGATGYDTLILLNAAVNSMLSMMGREKISLSKKVKDGVKKAVKFINDFETTAAEIAADHGFHTVICGHIHAPQIKKIKTSKGTVTYLNSGDWVENLTALEYNNKQWSIYDYRKDLNAQSLKIPKRFARELDEDEIFRDLVSQLIPEKK
ncbi:MAG: UDP-2,3-diacylglucosamine diphosphatase [Flammeovirgaceae bacterium]|nr:UDP-2,3-diacylglucosamine diphosphatase [Flammeovirgaceae bacterium]